MSDRLERELKLKDEIRHRLESICSNLSPREFAELIDQIASNQLKGEYRPFRFGSGTHIDDSGVSGLKASPRPRRSA